MSMDLRCTPKRLFSPEEAGTLVRVRKYFTTLSNSPVLKDRDSNWGTERYELLQVNPVSETDELPSYDPKTSSSQD